mgnify:CR=1 FL=1
MDLTPMTDDDLRRALGRLGIDQTSLRALPLLPLVQVAWADGRVQDAERGLIHEIAVKYGLGDAGLQLLNRWLDVRPSEKSFLLARRVLLALWARDRERGEAPESLDGVIRMCLCVGRVAGGLFGLAFTLDRRERELIGEISQSLQLGPSLSSVGRQVLTPALPAPRIESLSRAATAPRSHRGHTPARPPRAESSRDHPSMPVFTAPAYGATELTAPENNPFAADPRLGSEPPAAAPAVDPLATTARHPTLTPVERMAEAATMPLESLRRVRDDEDTELDLPVLPQSYDAAHADWVDDWDCSTDEVTTDRG